MPKVFSACSFAALWLLCCQPAEPKATKSTPADKGPERSDVHEFLFRIGSYRTDQLAAWVTDRDRAGVQYTSEGWFDGEDRLDYYGWADPLILKRIGLGQAEVVRGHADDQRRREALPPLSEADCKAVLAPRTFLATPSSDRYVAMLFALSLAANQRLPCAIDDIVDTYAAEIGLESQALLALGCRPEPGGQLRPRAASEPPWAEMYRRNPRLFLVYCLPQDAAVSAELAAIPADVRQLRGARSPDSIEHDRHHIIRAHRLLQRSDDTRARDEALTFYKRFLHGPGTSADRWEVFQALLEHGSPAAMKLLGDAIAEDRASDAIIGLAHRRGVVGPELLDGIARSRTPLSCTHPRCTTGILEYLDWARERELDGPSKAALQRASHAWRDDEAQADE